MRNIIIIATTLLLIINKQCSTSFRLGQFVHAPFCTQLLTGDKPRKELNFDTTSNTFLTDRTCRMTMELVLYCYVTWCLEERDRGDNLTSEGVTILEPKC